MRWVVWWVVLTPLAGALYVFMALILVKPVQQLRAGMNRPEVTVATQRRRLLLAGSAIVPIGSLFAVLIIRWSP